ncbi:hypothetical protein AB4298_10725 [Shewanella sp. 10N.261.52.F9]|uniref:hypothetical protein n=1 Tax=Shewanella TaxID=22 RepID=UPI0020109D13|nr:hypothetical protein [Shewanella marinintestina]MCL1145517.1 hypothetical protein [Shewanella marinintestina]
MYKTTKKTVWYGELRTARGNTILIHDKQFPDASAGRVYFYNATREAIIEYAEDIVKPNLHELDDQAIAEVEKNFGAAWFAAREEFMAKHQGWVEANNPKSAAAPKKAKAAPAEDDDEPELASADGDDYDDDWSDDYDD